MYNYYNSILYDMIYIYVYCVYNQFRIISMSSIRGLASISSLSGAATELELPEPSDAPGRRSR